jgi:hypothetical protein
MLKIKSLKVESVDVYPDMVVPVTPVLGRNSYERIRDLKAENGVFLPPWHILEKEDWGVNDLCTTDSWFEVITHLLINGKTYRLYVKFDEAWLTDLASVPFFLRSFVDNDDQCIIPASQVHDALFCLAGSNLFDFAGTNRLFREMYSHALKKQNRSTVKSWLAYIAVSSPIGKNRWTKKRALWEKQGVSISMEEIR